MTFCPPGPAESWQGERGEPLPSVVHTTRHLLKYDRLPAPPCSSYGGSSFQRAHKRLGSAEWPKWQQSSWPRRFRPAEWSSLCPHGHRGLAELGCFLRGHLAGLCSYPSNAGTGISTWIRGGLVMNSRKMVHKVMTCLMHPVIRRLAGFRHIRT